eukprot:TRINITY_DN2046_c0_g1_i3.p1 TRINITY_DN2046_c0_g1~~TRINITY_DN2046_c0_g1_i3.p1  ORF type:complete len:876 (+),score=178.75 TRINITY_DN2046_c0_g1_i3:42-2669(+)
MGLWRALCLALAGLPLAWAQHGHSCPSVEVAPGGTETACRGVVVTHGWIGWNIEKFKLYFVTKGSGCSMLPIAVTRGAWSVEATMPSGEWVDLEYDGDVAAGEPVELVVANKHSACLPVVSIEIRYHRVFGQLRNVSTPAPDTSAPDTAAPATPAPDTPAPNTAAPNTAAPDTAAPDTPAPDTAAPITAAPNTAAPTTPAPDTPAPDTAAPITAAPDTVAPITAAPGTPAPRPPTPAPATSAPTTSPRTAPVPGTEPGVPPTPVPSASPTPAPPREPAPSSEASRGPMALGVLGTASPKKPQAPADVYEEVGKALATVRTGSAVVALITPSGSGALSLLLTGTVCDISGAAREMRRMEWFLSPLQWTWLGSAAAGAVAGNAALCAAAGAATFAALFVGERAALWRCRRGLPQHAGRPADHAVRVLAVVMRVLLPGTAVAAFDLLLWPPHAEGAALGAAAVTVVCAFPAAMAHTAYHTVPHRTFYAVDGRTKHSLCAAWCIGPGEWVDGDAATYTARRFGAFLREYRSEGAWFIALDTTFIAVLAGLRAAQGHARTFADCGHAKAAACAVTLLMLAAGAVVRPAVQRRDDILNAAVLALEGGALTAMACGYYAGDAAHEGFPASLWLLLAAAVLAGVKGVWNGAGEVWVCATRRRARLQTHVLAQPVLEPAVQVPATPEEEDGEEGQFKLKLTHSALTASSPPHLWNESMLSVGSAVGSALLPEAEVCLLRKHAASFSCAPSSAALQVLTPADGTSLSCLHPPTPGASPRGPASFASPPLRSPCLAPSLSAAMTPQGTFTGSVPPSSFMLPGASRRQTLSFSCLPSAATDAADPAARGRRRTALQATASSPLARSRQSSLKLVPPTPPRRSVATKL